MTQERKRASFAIEDMREGGGNLWGSAGPARATLIAGQFTKEPPSDSYTVEGNPIFARCQFLLAGEGPEEDRRVENSWPLGSQSGDNFTISENGDYLIPNSDDAHIVKDCKFGTFAGSLQNEGVPKPIMADFAFSKLVGMDGDFKRIVDKERNFADRPGQRKSKFPPSTLCLVKLHALPGEKAVGKANGQAQNVAQSGLTSSIASTEANSGGGDTDTTTMDYLTKALNGAKDKKLQRGQITLAVSKAAMGDSNRAVYAKRASEEEFLNTLAGAGIISYAAAEKGQPVILAA